MKRTLAKARGIWFVKRSWWLLSALMPLFQRPLLLLLLVSTAISAAEQSFIQQLLGANSVQKQQILKKHFSSGSYSWQAGTYELHQALALVSQPHYPVLVELGINENAQATLPALENSTWWQAIQALTNAFELEPAPPVLAPKQTAYPTYFGRSSVINEQRHQKVFGGLLRLRTAGNKRLPEAELQPNGPIAVNFKDISLTHIRGLTREVRSVDVAYSLRLQPNMNQSVIDYASVHWRKAQTENGKSIPILTKSENDILLRSLRDGEVPHRNNRQRMHFSRNSSIKPIQKIRLDKIPPGAERITLTGECVLSCRTRLQGTSAVRIGESRSVEGIPIAMTSSLMKTPVDEAGSFKHQITVRYKLKDLSATPQILVYTEDGQTVKNTRQHEEKIDDEKIIICKIPEATDALYQVRVSCDLSLGLVNIPLEASLEIP